MITFNASFISENGLVKKLLVSGMNIARIYCGHDNQDTRTRMIKLLNKAKNETGLDCKIYMVLGGPKIRTILPGKGAKKG